MKKYSLIGTLGLLATAVSGEPLFPPTLVDEETCLLHQEYDGRGCLRNLEAFIHDYDGLQFRFNEELNSLSLYTRTHDDAVDASELVAYMLDGEYAFPQNDEELLEQSLVHYFLIQQVDKVFVAAYDVNADHHINIKDDFNGDNCITAEDKESYQRQLKMPFPKEGEVLAQNSFK
jgi:hypothetical protein